MRNKLFSTNGAQPISLKLLKGLGCCPTSFCTSGYRRALLANSIYGVSKQTGFCKNRRVYIHLLCLLFCKFSRWQVRRFSQVVTHLICLLFFVFHVSKRHFLNGNRRQLPPCLPKSETDGRKSMAAQPFILTIDGVRPFCYSDRIFT